MDEEQMGDKVIPSLTSLISSNEVKLSSQEGAAPYMRLQREPDCSPCTELAYTMQSWSEVELQQIAWL